MKIIELISNTLLVDKFKLEGELEETLNKMHDQNILHRDVKSGNIIESENEDVSFPPRKSYVETKTITYKNNINPYPVYQVED